jgi:prefoldin subunit 5
MVKRNILPNNTKRIEIVENHIMTINREMGEVKTSIENINDRMKFQEKVFIAFDIGIITLIVISIYASLI